MLEEKRAVTFEVCAGHLNVGIGTADIELPRERGSHGAVATLVVDRRNLVAGIVRLIEEREQTEVANEFWRQELFNEALIAIVCPGVLQRRHVVTRSRQLRKPFP